MATRKPEELQRFPRALAGRVVWGTRPASVRYVVDGDTFGALVDWGGANYRFETVRLAGIDADPPTGDAGRAAAAELARMLPMGARVVLATRGVDAYGRIVAEVEAMAPDGAVLDVAAALVAAGHARVVEG